MRGSSVKIQKKYSPTQASEIGHTGINEKFYAVIKIIFTHGESKESEQYYLEHSIQKRLSSTSW